MRSLARCVGADERAGPLNGRSGFNTRLTLIACKASNGKEVEDVFGRPDASVGLARHIRAL